MRISQRWSNIFISIYLQSSLLRAVCYPLLHQEPDWNVSLYRDLRYKQANLVYIVHTMQDKLINLENNSLDNAYRALPNYLDERWNKYGNYQLMKFTYMYLNKNFGYGPYGDFTKFNVVLVQSTNVTYRDSDLFYYSKSDNRSIVVGLGKLWPKYSCDQQTDNGVKKLTCYKIGDKVITYDGEHQPNEYFDSQYWNKLPHSNRFWK